MAADTRTDLQAHLDSFLIDCRARRLAAGTIDFYRAKLRVFLAYLQGEEVQTVDAITPAVIRAYLAGMQDRGLKAHTQHASARAIRTWCNWLAAEGEIAQSPMKRVRMPKLDNPILPAFTPEEVQALLDACLISRDKAIVFVLLDTGVRARELLALDVGDVDLTTGAVMVRQGKGGKDRIVYLGAKTRQALQRYLRRRQDVSMGASSPLWVSRSGGRLKLAGLRQVLRRLAERSGVEHCHPHRFRRTFALWSLRAGMDIYSLQRLMGHADLDMLRRYLAQVEGDLRTAHHKFGAVDSNL